MLSLLFSYKHDPGLLENFFIFGVKLSWGILKAAPAVVFSPVILIGMVVGGLIYIHFHLLIIGGILHLYHLTHKNTRREEIKDMI